MKRDNPAVPKYTMYNLIWHVPVLLLCFLFLLVGTAQSPEEPSLVPDAADRGPAGIILDVSNGGLNKLASSPLASSPTRLYLGGYSCSGVDLDPGPADFLCPAYTYFVAAYDHSFSFKWAITWQLERGATAKSRVAELQTDKQGNLVCLVEFDGSLRFQDSRYGQIPVGSRAWTFPWVLMFKADDSGNIIWKQAWEGFYDRSLEYFPVFPRSVLDHESNIYVVANPFELRKYNAEGVLIWCYYTGVRENSIACDSHGNVYLAGYYLEDRYYEGTMSDLGRGQHPLLPLFSLDRLRAYNDQSIIVKLDKRGHFLWAVGWQGTPLPEVAVQDDKLYAVGKCQRDVGFVGGDGRTAPLGGQGGSLVLRLSDMGALEWWETFSALTGSYGISGINEVGIYVGGWQLGNMKVGADGISDPGWFLLKVEDESLKIVAYSKSGPPPVESWSWNRVYLVPDYHGGAFLGTVTKKHAGGEVTFDSYWDEQGPSEGFNLLILRLANVQLIQD